MDRLFSRNGLATLYDEDFDQPAAPPPAPEPEVIEPVFSAAEIEAARETAWNEGQAAATDKAEHADTAIARQALVQIVTQLDNARSEANRVAEEAAEAMARLLCDGFATAFPALSERHGEVEIQGIVRAVLPALRNEPKITIRLHALAVRAVAHMVEQLDPDLLERVELIPTDAMLPGDMRIAWRNGSATRDTRSLWRQIADILAPTGLLSPPQSVPAPPAVAIPQAVKEIDRVE